MFWTVLGVLAVPGAVLLIPRFLVLKELTLFNSYPGMILPIAADAAGIFLMRQFFVGIPPTMEEAARIDGAGGAALHGRPAVRRRQGVSRKIP